MNEQLSDVGAAMVGATTENLKALASTARTIAAICEAKASNAIPLLVGDKDVLPALHKALGSGLEAGYDLHKAQLRTLLLSRRHKLLLDEAIPNCPCGEGGERGTSPLTLVASGGEAIAA